MIAASGDAEPELCAVTQVHSWRTLLRWAAAVGVCLHTDTYSMERQQSIQLSAPRAQPTRRTVSSDFKEAAFQIADSQAWSPKQDARSWSTDLYQCQGWQFKRRYAAAAATLLLLAATAWLISRLAPCLSPLQVRICDGTKNTGYLAIS